jgi:hypothetical protein
MLTHNTKEKREDIYAMNPRKRSLSQYVEVHLLLGCSVFSLMKRKEGFLQSDIDGKIIWRCLKTGRAA